MYRDDRCAVCGVALPPDHVYCRDHGRGVDRRLHALAEALAGARAALRAASDGLATVAEETWDFLAEPVGDPEWPPRGSVRLTVPAEDVDVTVAEDPGSVVVDLDVGLRDLLAVVADVLDAPEVRAAEAACRGAEGADGTH